MSAAGDARPVRATVAMHHGRPTLFLNDTAVVPMVYALTDVPGGRLSWEELPRRNILRFAEAGVRLFQLDVFLEQLWEEGRPVDISLLRRQIAGVRDVVPGAGVIIRFHITAPKWWMRTHPEEWVRYADTDYADDDLDGFPRILEDDNGPVRRVSLASEVWKAEAAAKLREILRQLAATPEGEGLAGIQVADGVYGEWHMWGFYRHEPDTSLPMQAAFRAWLRKKYASDRALRSAWARPTVALASARVPGLSERQSPDGIIRDPSKGQQAMDYYTFQHELVAETILGYARIVRAVWPRPILTGTFYGYYFSVFSRQAAGGHLELQRILRSPDIDYLSGPQAYEPESLKPGEAYRSRSLIMSVRLHGKLWLDEMDNEPTIPIRRDARFDLLLRTAVANVRRNLSFTATKGMGLWFYDFGVGGVDLDGFRYNHRGSRGFWDNDTVMAEIARLRRLFESRMDQEYTSEADVLLVYDTKSFYHTASLRGSDPVSSALLDRVSLAAFKSGVVFDPVHVDDLPLVDLAQYRVIVFGNTFVLSDEQRSFIQKEVAGGQRTLVWYYAPGLSDGRSLEHDRIGTLTGIRVRPVTLPTGPVISARFASDSATTFGHAGAPLSPLFAVDDPKARVYGTFAGTDIPALARKELPASTAWFVSVPGSDVEPLRSILQEGGAHRYTQAGEIVYGGGGLLVVHSSGAGAHEVTLRDGRVVRFESPEGATTVLLDSRTGDVILPPQP
jgi:hypothetical protein